MFIGPKANHRFSFSSKARQKQGSFPPPALPGITGNMTPSDSRLNQHTVVLLRVATPHPGRASHFAQDTFLTCCPHYPGGSEIGGSVMSLSRFGLPRILGGSASTTVLSGPAQGSLALRSARLLQPYRLTSVPRDSAGRSPYPTVWVATGMNRQFSGRNSHPLAPCALVAHQYIVVRRISFRSRRR